MELKEYKKRLWRAFAPQALNRKLLVLHNRCACHRPNWVHHRRSRLKSQRAARRVAPRGCPMRWYRR